MFRMCHPSVSWNEGGISLANPVLHQPLGEHFTGGRKKMKRKEQTPKATKPEPTKKINEEVGDDTQIEGTDLTKEVKLNIWPQKIAKGSMMSIWRNPQYVLHVLH